MVVNIPKESIIACICEGGAETAIMDILLDNDIKNIIGCIIRKRTKLLFTIC